MSLTPVINCVCVPVTVLGWLVGCDYFGAGVCLFFCLFCGAMDAHRELNEHEALFIDSQDSLEKCIHF